MPETETIERAERNEKAAFGEALAGNEPEAEAGKSESCFSARAGASREGGC
jgi:hypothetical protein